MTKLDKKEDDFITVVFLSGLLEKDCLYKQSLLGVHRYRWELVKTTENLLLSFKVHIVAFISLGLYKKVDLCQKYF